MELEDLLNRKAIKNAFNMLEVSYDVLLDMRNAFSPDTTILLNSYDFAMPDGRGVCFKGPWLRPGLIHRNVPIKMRTDVVEMFMREYNKFITQWAKKNKNIIIVPTQGILAKSDWANELHPTNYGFEEVAKIFKKTIEKIR